MGAVRRIIRVLSIVWAFIGVSAFILEVRAPGSVMLASWAKSVAWPLGIRLYETGAETTESIGLLFANSLGQFIFHFGWIAPLLLTRARKPKEGLKPFTPHPGV
jgi:hypothetical protein